MNCLVINAGSSSVKFQVISLPDFQLVAKGLLDRIGEGKAELHYERISDKLKVENAIDAPTHSQAFLAMEEQLLNPESGCIASVNDIAVVGHRVVHGGEKYTSATIVNEQVKKNILELAELAPLHNPANLKGIEVGEQVFYSALHVAVFDTAFHQTMPEKAFRYAIPNSFYHENKIRVYGMHGTSHYYITKTVAKHLNKPSEETNIISIHLGNGCSICAIKNGECIDTSMGFSPLAGLMMGTRSGDIDPAVLLFMQDRLGMSSEDINHTLNKQSGLKGLAGSNDMRDVCKRADEGDTNAILALEMYAYRIKKYIGAYIISLACLPDAIVFTAGIGENSSLIREKATSNLQHLGIELDIDKNKKLKSGIQEIQSAGSRVKILRVPTNEELEIAQQAFVLYQ